MSEICDCNGIVDQLDRETNQRVLQSAIALCEKPDRSYADYLHAMSMLGWVRQSELRRLTEKEQRMKLCGRHEIAEMVLL